AVAAVGGIVSGSRGGPDATPAVRRRRRPVDHAATPSLHAYSADRGPALPAPASRDTRGGSRARQRGALTPAGVALPYHAIGSGRRLSRSVCQLGSLERPPSGSARLVDMIAAARTDVGMIRSGNEDAYFADVTRERGLFIVADGMGGHAAGEVASEMAVQIVSRELHGMKDLESEAARERMAESIRLANRAIYDRTIAESDKQGKIGRAHV